MDKEIKVAIACQTYNQAKYIRQMLDGFVMQKTNFRFVAYVGDDCSTDGTKEIIEEYAKKYPEIIKPIYQQTNTKGAMNFMDTFNACKAQYVAWCEGDDYWTDENKLQKQADFLDCHPDYSGCFHPVKVIYENNEKKSAFYPAKKTMLGKNKITLNELLHKNYIQTNSIMYRWRFQDGSLGQYFFEYILPGDWYLHLLHAKCGPIGYIDEVMSVYRRQPQGIWYDSIANPERLKLNNGLYMFNFYKNVYKNIADCSQNYFQNVLAPITHELLLNYFNYGDFEKLQEFKNLNKDLFNQFFPLQEKDRFKKKYKKYKKLFEIFLISTITLIFILITLLVLYTKFKGEI
ncbi:glycosyltransferase [bacterium]|nr:glycosyltransferase [bacterium]